VIVVNNESFIWSMKLAFLKVVNQSLNFIPSISLALLSPHLTYLLRALLPIRPLAFL